jgi:hypothetical protein
MVRTRKKRLVAAIKHFYGTPFIQKVKTILQEVALVALIIVCLKGIGALMAWAAFSPWLDKSFGVVKGVIFLILYIVASHEVLDEFGLWKMIEKIQKAVKGNDDHSSSFVAA